MNNKKTIFILFCLFMIFSLSYVYSANVTDNLNTSCQEHQYNERLNLLYDNLSRKYENNKNNFTLFTIREKNNQTEDYDINKLNKSRPIYFAMDHVNADDEKICDTITKRLKEEGFNVVKAEIGPNKMSQNTHYLYEHNISNAIIFHLFNGVDPSTIRELATEGNDNFGKTVRSNGNDVVLAWFYDSVDCVNENGSGTAYVYGSETGPSMENPKQYMEDNEIIAICTSSDMGKHKENADYTGEKTVNEFIELFNK
ncbi:MAG TPA: hypothetical protein HA355_00665 [Methanosphaera sp.]|nr:hypothetical protein [Methanosphaera sp.]